MISQTFVSVAQTKNAGEKDSLQQVEPNESFYKRDASLRWIRELRNVIIVSPKNEATDSFNIESSSDIYLDAKGLTIISIRIVRLKPFGASLTDTVFNNVKVLGRVGNAIHVNTGEFIIRNALMFKEGEKVDGLKLAYSERYLRSLRYINDVRIFAVPVSDEEAEVTVIVRDIFPYTVDFGTNFESRLNFSITNRNLLGLGLEVNAGAFMDSRKDHLMGYVAKLRIHNIGRSFISFQADYLDRYENRRLGFTLRRDFHSPATKYAGHLIYYKARTPVRYIVPDVQWFTIKPITVSFKHLDAWLGRSFQIKNNRFIRQQRNITVSLGAQHMYFTDRPEKSEEHYYRFQNRTTFLSSFTYSQRAFYKANLIYNFGRTEDIPYGYQLSVVGGKEVNEMYNRPYFGANYSSGYFIPGFGYLSGTVSYGSFFRKVPDQGIINLEMNYFTNLYVLGRFRPRTFLNGQYTRQLYNPLNDRLVIDGVHGIPGFRNDSIMGRKRFNLSVEQNFFTPWNFYEFRFVLYAFAYLSWLGDYDKPVLLSPLYSSFGFGIRIRNNRLVFSTLQIQFAYFPNIPKNSRFHYITFSKETVLQPRDFIPKAPDVIPMY